MLDTWVKDFNEQEIHVHRLYTHPCNSGETEVVNEGTKHDANNFQICTVNPDQEWKVETKESKAEIN